MVCLKGVDIISFVFRAVNLNRTFSRVVTIHLPHLFKGIDNLSTAPFQGLGHGILLSVRDFGTDAGD